MVPRSDRTRPGTKADARQYLAKAEEFLGAMESALAADQWDAAGLAAVHSGISAADAVLSYRGGVRSAGQDHRAAAELLVQVLGLPPKTARSISGDSSRRRRSWSTSSDA